MNQLSLNPVGGYLLVAIAAIVMIALLFVGPGRSRTTPRQRVVLLLLRLGVLLAVLFAMVRPANVFTKIQRQRATLVVLADRSRSMGLSDTLGDQSRWDSLNSVIETSAPLLEKLAKDFDIKPYSFDSRLYLAKFDGKKIDFSTSPTGEQTAIGAALETVLQQVAGERVAGVLLLSDGSQRAYAPYNILPQTATRRLADLHYPLYTFVLGSSRSLAQSQDLAIKTMETAPTIFVKNQLQVTGSLRNDGFADRNVTVQLLFETAPGKLEVVDAKQIRTGGSGQELPFAFDYEPQAAGEYKVRVQAEVQDGELVTTNNRLSTFVSVLKGGVSVLYLEGALRVEQRFLRAALDASANVKLDLVRVNPNNRKNWPIDLEDKLDYGKYDVYLLGDVDSSALKKEDWLKIAENVDRGTGMMMIGGYHSFGPGGFLQTALADVLPIRMDRLERQNYDEPVQKDLHLEGPIRLRPTSQFGLQHAVTSLVAGEENKTAWGNLPPLDGANRFGGLKPTGVVLLETDDKMGHPILVASGWGNGRVLAFAGDTTWHWALEGHEPLHKRFWRQSILWLARKDQSSDANVWIKLAQRRFAPGSRVQFLLGADSPEGDPLVDAKFDVQIQGPDDAKHVVATTRSGEHHQATFFETQRSGDYTIRVQAFRQGKLLGSSQSRFLVFQQDLELDNPAANPGLMKSLADMTAVDGGKALAAEELPALLTEILENPPDLEVETQQKRTYWDSWPLLVVFIGLLAIEWYLRKRWRLV